MTSIPQRAESGQVEVRVIDHGPGVPAADWERIFLPFQRLGDRDNFTGVGLGLALARGLIEAMGGTTPQSTPPAAASRWSPHAKIVRVPSSARQSSRQACA